MLHRACCYFPARLVPLLAGTGRGDWGIVFVPEEAPFRGIGEMYTAARFQRAILSCADLASSNVSAFDAVKRVPLGICMWSDGGLSTRYVSVSLSASLMSRCEYCHLTLWRLAYRLLSPLTRTGREVSTRC